MQHTSLANGRWQTLSFFEQLASIGSEVERALNWQAKKNPEYSQRSFERALELLDLSLALDLKPSQHKELSLARTVLVDYFSGTNQAKSTPKQWRRYFGAFSYAAQLQRGR